MIAAHSATADGLKKLAAANADLHFKTRNKILQARYDKDTDHGTIPLYQKIWKDRMAAVLASPRADTIGGFYSYDRDRPVTGSEKASCDKDLSAEAESLPLSALALVNALRRKPESGNQVLTGSPQALFQIANQIGRILQPDRQPHHVGAGACGDLLAGPTTAGASSEAGWMTSERTSPTLARCEKSFKVSISAIPA